MLRNDGLWVRRIQFTLRFEAVSDKGLLAKAGDQVMFAAAARLPRSPISGDVQEGESRKQIGTPFVFLP